MKEFIGTKIIEAEPMTTSEFKYRIGRDASVNLGDIGKRGYMVRYQDGYTSWSPKDVFEEAYHETDRMNFGDAIYMLKQGKKVARSKWNGKGQYVFMIGVPGSNDYWTYTNGKNDNYPLRPFFALKTADDQVVPWLASMSDMIEEDWCVVE